MNHPDRPDHQDPEPDPKAGPSYGALEDLDRRLAALTAEVGVENIVDTFVEVVVRADTSDA